MSRLELSSADCVEPGGPYTEGWPTGNHPSIKKWKSFLWITSFVGQHSWKYTCLWKAKRENGGEAIYCCEIEDPTTAPCGLHADSSHGGADWPPPDPIPWGSLGSALPTTGRRPAGSCGCGLHCQGMVHVCFWQRCFALKWFTGGWPAWCGPSGPHSLDVRASRFANIFWWCCLNAVWTLKLATFCLVLSICLLRGALCPLSRGPWDQLMLLVAVHWDLNFGGSFCLVADLDCASSFQCKYQNLASAKYQGRFQDWQYLAAWKVGQWETRWIRFWCCRLSQSKQKLIEFCRRLNFFPVESCKENGMWRKKENGVLPEVQPQFGEGRVSQLLKGIPNHWNGQHLLDTWPHWAVSPL